MPLRIRSSLTRRKEAFRPLRDAEVGMHETPVQSLVDQRQAARTQRDFAEADRLRDELAGLGVVRVDTPTGTRRKLGP
jgi:cysteinyl-tRNA synthetase